MCIRDRGIIGPEDFTTPLYHQAAQLFFAQHEEGEVNPARLLNQFSEPEEQKEDVYKRQP